MLIKGIQKNSLIDWPPNLVSTLFTGGCNFRCPWCHNPGLVESSSSDCIEGEEIDSLICQRKEWIDGICLSGGEPLLQEEVLDFLKKIKEKGIKIKLDTNGYFPVKLKNIIDQKLVEYIAMDIKAPLEKTLYSSACGVDLNISRIKQSITAIMDSSIDYEFRTTAVPGIIDSAEIEEIAGFIKGAKKFMIQNFRGGDTLDKSYAALKPYGTQKMDELKKVAGGYVHNVGVR